MEREERLAKIAAPILFWYDENRRDLPWRRTGDPYGIWVSEIMLQQTRVGAVLEHYRRWMEELPTVEALAEVDEERLMKLWQGLGYYSRARNLQKAAQYIVREKSGVFPDTYEELLQLPGVGEYTAGAVASIAFGRAIPAVDGNVLRVAARVADIREDILDPAVRREIRNQMAQAMSRDRPGAYNQALMDLGAMICLPNGTPLCEECPLRAFCRARELGEQASLPVRRKKPPRRVEELTVLVLLQRGSVAIRKRPDSGLLAGLWEFPWLSGTPEVSEIGETLANRGLTVVDWREKLLAKHLFTHVEWRMTGYVLEVRGSSPDLTFVDEDGLDGAAIPSAFKKYAAAARAAIKN